MLELIASEMPGSKLSKINRCSAGCPLTPLSGQTGIDLRRLSHETDIDFSVNVLPFLCCTQFGKQCVELSLMGWRELEPIEKIERFIFREVAAVMELARYCRQVVEPDLNVL